MRARAASLAAALLLTLGGAGAAAPLTFRFTTPKYDAVPGSATCEPDTFRANSRLGYAFLLLKWYDGAWFTIDAHPAALPGARDSFTVDPINADTAAVEVSDEHGNTSCPSNRIAIKPVLVDVPAAPPAQFPAVPPEPWRVFDVSGRLEVTAADSVAAVAAAHRLRPGVYFAARRGARAFRLVVVR